MKFLVDNQLPAALARYLRDRGFDCIHVLDVSMGQADDLDIWRFAAGEGMVLITKDEDFVHLAAREGPDPRVVWVRLGNCRNQVLWNAFQKGLEQIVELLAAGERIVEVR